VAFIRDLRELEPIMSWPAAPLPLAPLPEAVAQTESTALDNFDPIENTGL